MFAPATELIRECPRPSGEITRLGDVPRIARNPPHTLKSTSPDTDLDPILFSLPFPLRDPFWEGRWRISSSNRNYRPSSRGPAAYQPCNRFRVTFSRASIMNIDEPSFLENVNSGGDNSVPFIGGRTRPFNEELLHFSRKKQTNDCSFRAEIFTEEN